MPLRCGNCASEMPDGMHFCGVCGQSLAVACSVCGTPAAVSGQRFCGSCGTPLAVADAAPRERRLVSVLFCDMVDFTPFTESRDPEDVRDVLEQYFAAARTVVARYGGNVEKFIGDAVLAVWGAPLAREDDAERAVRAALQISAAVEQLGQRLGLAELRVRVGVLTGEAAVDMGGADRGMLVGDSVNTASRIQSVAAPGTVLVDDTTRQACERVLVFADAGLRELKGKSAPVRVWQALRVRDPASDPRSPDAVLAPLVGRDEQLRAIAAELTALRADGAQPRLVSVIAEAGLGKSRLAAEVQAHAVGEAPVSWQRGRATSLGEETGLGALAQMVAVRARIADGDSRARRIELAGELIDECFQPYEPDAERVRRAVLRLLDLDDGRALLEQGELFSAWRALFERLAASGPLGLVFEELQSADQALLDFIAHLLEWARDAPILTLALGRPDARLEALAGRGARIGLPPLRDCEMDELVRGAVLDAPDALLAAVRADGGGVPLYAVETLRALADRGVLAARGDRYVVLGELGEVSVPPTVRALVASRLDGLGVLERRALTAGAVLGERFSASAVAAVAGLDEADARTLLDSLAGRALLALDCDPRSPSHGSYGFLQGVVRRVALDRLARRERRSHHLAAADYVAAQRAEFQRPSALASHLLAALEADPAAPDADTLGARARAALREAAERAAAVGALEQALSLYDRAADLSSAQAELPALLESAAAVANRAGDGRAAARRYRAAADAHAAAGRERERLRARANELRSLRYLQAPAELLEQLRAVHATLADEQDAASALAGATLAYTLYQCGAHDEALEVATRAVAAAQRSDAVPELLQALSAQGQALAELARPQEAIDVFAGALALAETHAPRLAASLAANIAVALGSLGRYADAAARALEAIAAAERNADRSFERWGRLVLGRVRCSLGEYDQAIAAIEAARDGVPPALIGMVTAPLVVIALARGEQRRARELVAEHDRRAADGDPSVFESDFRLLRAAVLVAPGDGGEPAAIVARAQLADYAEWTGWLAPIVDRLVRPESHGSPAQPAEHLRRALAALRAPGAMKQTAPVLAQALRLQAHLAARDGDAAGAGELFTRARRLARECGLAFEAAAIELERVECGCEPPGSALDEARETFARLRAAPWLARARATQETAV